MRYYSILQQLTVIYAHGFVYLNWFFKFKAMTQVQITQVTDFYRDVLCAAK